MMQSQSVNSATQRGPQSFNSPQSGCNIGPSNDQTQRKRFDSVASPFTTNQPSPSDIQPSTQRARPDLRADCWNSPLCPRNMAANGVTGSNLPPDCGPAKAQPPAPRATAAAVEICAEPPSTTSPLPTSPSAKRLKIAAPADLSPDAPATIPNSSSTSKPPEKRLPHHIIERRYRENLNISIEHLRAAVPTTTACLTLDMEDIGSANANPNAGIRPLSKAGVIAHAAEYMRQLAAQNEEVERANREMRVTVEALRRLVNCEDCGVVQRIVDAGGSGGC